MVRLALLLLLATLHIRQVALSGCDVTMTASSGVIRSPGYPGNYPPSTVCDYTIITEPGTTIRLTFEHFNLEGDCRFDYLQIADGESINARNLGKFCGSGAPLSGEIRSSQNSLFLRFRSDTSKQYGGFLASYSTIWLITPSVTNISVTSLSSSSIRVHWWYSHRSIEIHNYTVTVKSLARRHSPSPDCPALPPVHLAITVTVNGSTTETDINLPADLEFQVTVTAASPSVLIAPSDTVIGCTLPKASDPVRDLNVDLKTTVDSVIFTWKAPCDPGGVLGYFLVVLEGGGNHRNAQKHILNQTATQPMRASYSTSMFISNLTAECMYHVTVTPVGPQGLYGANHSTTFQVPARVPTQTQNVSATALSVSVVRVQWEPPSQYHGTLTNYTVTLQPMAKPHTLEAPQHTAVVTVNASTLATDINHLLPDTEFQTTVTAATSAGQGPPSATFLAHTPSEVEVPTQPQNVSATALSISAVRVEWEPPAQYHGTLAFYTVTLQPLARRISPPLFLPKRVVTVTGATLQTDVNDLLAGSDYQATVTAATSAGQGPPSAPTLVHTPSETKIPLQPQNVSATALSSSQVLVQWEPPVESTGTVTRYTVTLQPVAHHYTPLSRMHMAVVTVSGPALEANINYLPDDAEFQVTVTAVTAAGQGPPSESTMVHTFPTTKVPLQPQNVSATALTSSQVLVQWEPPVESTGTVTSYTVTLQPVAHHYTPLSRMHTAVVTVSGPAVEANINHLPEDTEFQVNVFAVTAAGQGPPSESIMVYTFPKTNGKILLVLEVLVGFAAAGLVILFVKWVVTYKRKNTSSTCTNQQADSQKDLALNDLIQCD